MTVLELQKRLQELYKEYGDIEVVILNKNDNNEFQSIKYFENVECVGFCPNEIICLF
jgi:hypothetical protein|nr:MAG TPA: hypothetical protein [Caudoviricetes sp.]